MFLLALLSLVSATEAPPAPTPPEPAVWKIRLDLPFLSGFNHLFRDAPPPSAAVYSDPAGADWRLIGVSLARQWQGRWTAEAHAGYVFEVNGALDPLVRKVLGLRGGRYFTLRDRRGANGRGGVTILAPLGGVAYRGRGYHDIGQFSIALTSALALDYTFFTSRRWGWSFRARIDGALVVHQAGPPIWRDYEGPLFQDGYRGHLGLGLDLGVAF